MHRIVIDRNHELHIHNDTFSAYASGLRLFRFNVKSRMPIDGNDDTAEKVELVEKGEAKAVWIGTGGAFAKKEYTVRVIDRGFVFTTKVTGCGAPERIEYFRGCGGSAGSAFSVSGFVLPDFRRENAAGSIRSIDAVPAVIAPHGAYVPPFVFPFCNDYNGEWCALGVTTRAGNQNYGGVVFDVNANENGESGCSLTLPLGGYTEINGEWKAPTVWCGFAKDAVSALGAYSEWNYSHYGFKKNVSAEYAPGLLFSPVCGEVAPDVNRYGELNEKLNYLGIKNGIILTDLTSKQFGTLFADENGRKTLRLLADGCHADGRYLAVKINFADADGLPDDECIFAGEKRISVDPTSPKYLERLEKTIHTLLSSDDGGCGCDGISVVFDGGSPFGRGAVMHEKGVCGLELLHRLLGAVYKFSKDANPGALIISGAAHPYLAEYCDRFELNGSRSELNNSVSSIRFGAAAAKAVIPGITVGIGGFSGKTPYEQLRIFETAAEEGIPELYPFTESLTEKFWARVREIFNENK